MKRAPDTSPPLPDSGALHTAMDNHSRHPGRSDGPPAQHEPAHDCGESAIAARIRQLKARSSRGLYNVVAFIAVSIIAVANLTTYQSLPESFRIVLGTPPSATMISAALIVYSFSAILTILARMTLGSGSYGGMTHVGFLTVFYAFYYFSGYLEENFWGVFAAGMTVLGLEAYHIWNWCAEEIRRQREGEDEPDRDGY